MTSIFGKITAIFAENIGIDFSLLFSQAGYLVRSAN